jgi:hypothetical protein
MSTTLFCQEVSCGKGCVHTVCDSIPSTSFPVPPFISFVSFFLVLFCSILLVLFCKYIYDKYIK